MAEQHRVENVLVVGAGVSGLTTALELARVREDGEPRYQVQVVAERPADKTVSVIAGALWEFPPAVCGQHGNQLSIMRSKRWSVESYKEFRKLAPNAGVHMVTSNFYFGIKIEDDWLERTKMRELQKLSEEEEIEGFRRLTQEEIKKVPASFQVKDGYQLRVPAVPRRGLPGRERACSSRSCRRGRRAGRPFRPARPPTTRGSRRSAPAPTEAPRHGPAEGAGAGQRCRSWPSTGQDE
ncbi:FAD-dependent oxidoreductase [Streptomyces sp. NPDC053513]|uniref:FAD-dependent oxidoreductase n=1 Tax=unclassified Streptomyces TaxID=2593676 RepID=UPI0037CCFD2F